MRINNPKNMNNEELLSKIYIDDNSFVGDGSENNKLQLAQGYYKDYTAFEVFAHDYDIPVGECEELGDYVNNAISAKMTHKFCLKIEGDIETNDVIIDWGDNTESIISNNEYEDIYTYMSDPNLKDLLLSHTYEANGKYIIKIFGKDYYTFRHHIITFTDSTTNEKYKDNGDYNLVCRILSDDLPIASHITTHASMFRTSLHLLNVNINDTNNFKKSKNIVSCFFKSSNLLSVNGLSSLDSDCLIQSLFYDCISLIDTDLVFPQNVEDISTILRNCSKLTKKIESFFTSNQYFYLRKCNQAFVNCKLLSGTIPANNFWNNKYVTHVDGSSGTHYWTFLNANVIKDQAPISWNGTASDDIIESTIEQNVDELNDRLAVLEDADLINRLATLEAAASSLADI